MFQGIASTTVMLFFISFMFLILTVPYDIYFIGYDNGTFIADTPERVAIKQYVGAIATILAYTNNSINFLMYFISGRKFRLAAWDTMTCRWCRGKSPTSGGRTSTAMTATTSRMTAVTGTRMENVSSAVSAQTTM